MTLVKACEASDLPVGEMMSVDIEGLQPIALYNIEGEFYATSNICTHAIAILTDGYLEGDIVECPLHGGCFNAKTGKATEFPCEEDLETYEVQVRDGSVYIKTE